MILRIAAPVMVIYIRYNVAQKFNLSSAEMQKIGKYSHFLIDFLHFDGTFPENRRFFMRKAEVIRTTKETDIAIAINLDGEGNSRVSTGIPFMDHMLTLFAKHGKFDLDVQVKGDLEIDCHHTMEDTGLALGKAIADALGDKAGITRYGHIILPMDEVLALVALDLSGRPYLVYDAPAPAQYIRELDVALFGEFFRALSNTCGMNLHIKILNPGETHHTFEAVFKAFGRALCTAVTVDPRVKGVPSTKGSL